MPVRVSGSLRLWPYASARTSLQSRFKNLRDDALPQEVCAILIELSES